MEENYGKYVKHERISPPLSDIILHRPLFYLHVELVLRRLVLRSNEPVAEQVKPRVYEASAARHV